MIAMELAEALRKTRPQESNKQRPPELEIIQSQLYRVELAQWLLDVDAIGRVIAKDDSVMPTEFLHMCGWNGVR